MSSWSESAHEKTDRVLGWKGRSEIRDATGEMSTVAGEKPAAERPRRMAHVLIEVVSSRVGS